MGKRWSSFIKIQEIITFDNEFYRKQRVFTK